jgi:hypothetical protein
VQPPGRDCAAPRCGELGDQAVVFDHLVGGEEIKGRLGEVVHIAPPAIWCARSNRNRHRTRQVRRTLGDELPPSRDPPSLISFSAVRARDSTGIYCNSGEFDQQSHSNS